MSEDANGKAYSYAFERLVDNEQDLEGAIAYALYKADKRDFIRSHGLARDDRRIAEYHLTALGPGNLKALDARARSLLSEYVSAAATAAEARAITQVDSQFEKLKASVESIKPHVERHTNFWVAIAASLLATFLFALILSVSVFLNQNSQNPLGTIYQILANGTRDHQPDKPSPKGGASVGPPAGSR